MFPDLGTQWPASLSVCPRPWCLSGRIPVHPFSDQSVAPFLQVSGHMATTAGSTRRQEASSCWAGGEVSLPAVPSEVWGTRPVKWEETEQQRAAES